MINNTGQELLIITADDGEILLRVKERETVNVRSAKQTENDKYYSPKNKIKVGEVCKSYG